VSFLEKASTNLVKKPFSHYFTAYDVTATT